MVSYMIPLILMLIPIVIGLIYGLCVRSRVISLLFAGLLAVAVFIILAVYFAPGTGLAA